MSPVSLRLVHLARIFLLAFFPKRIPVTLACAHWSPKLSRSLDLETAVVPMLLIDSFNVQTREPILMLESTPEAAATLKVSSELVKLSLI